MSEPFSSRRPSPAPPAASPAPEADERRVLRIVRESIRLEPPVVRFVAPPARYS